MDFHSGLGIKNYIINKIKIDPMWFLFGRNYEVKKISDNFIINDEIKAKKIIFANENNKK